MDRLTPLCPVQFSPVANFHGEIYSLPFNMYTFHRLWGVRTPEEAASKLAAERAAYADIEPRNLEEQALKLVGRDIYEKLVKGYTEKQWGRPATALPAFIIRRLPVRLTYNYSYFDDRFQGIPEDGYTKLAEALLYGVEVKTGVDFLADVAHWKAEAAKIVFTGRVDSYFGERLGTLEYRSLRFAEERLDTANYQGTAVMNYTAAEVPYTRITEHKHFVKAKSPVTVISREFPQIWREGLEPYYPVNDEKNDRLYQQYREAAKEEPEVIFGGRLGTYTYYNMDQVVEQALAMVAQETGEAE